MPEVRRTRATLRRAEFGFFGVVVNTRVQTPRRWGEPSSAGVLFFSTLSCRPLRTSCWIVGTTSPVSVCRWVQLTWNFADPRGRVCRIPRTPAARQKEAQIAVAGDGPLAVEGTHGSQGTPQAQGLSVPSTLTPVKTEALSGPNPGGTTGAPGLSARRLRRPACGSSHPHLTITGDDAMRTR